MAYQCDVMALPMKSPLRWRFWPVTTRLTSTVIRCRSTVVSWPPVYSTFERSERMARAMEDKVVIVSGAGSVGEGWGNGKAAAVLYAREGARVLAVDRNQEAAQVTADLIRSEGGVCEVVAADVSKTADIEAMVQAALDHFGRIDVLHNNVGIAETGGPVEASEESWNRVIAINQTSVFMTCKHVLPVMEKQKKGAIVNISSLAAIRWVGFPYVAYSASKAA